MLMPGPTTTTGARNGRPWRVWACAGYVAYVAYVAPTTILGVRSKNRPFGLFLLVHLTLLIEPFKIIVNRLNYH